MHAIRTLMRHMIDYAGLFPPASLSLEQAVANYARYRRQDVAWALGRFILPVARLDEFERMLPADPSAEPWQLSGLCTADLRTDIAAIQAFNARHAAGTERMPAMIDTLELKAGTADEISAAMQEIPADLTAYIEIPITTDPAALIHTIGRVGARAKVRTGGTSQDLFPAPDDLLRFIHTCVTAGVPFKATAGLHHPIRAQYRLTYEPDSASGTMYGFLNVFLCAAFLAAGIDIDAAMRVLLEAAPDAFQFDDAGVTWRAHRLDNNALAHLRQTIALSFGSCSFEEPIDDLKAMKLL